MADRFAHGESIRSEKPALGASRAKSDDGKATPRTPRNEKAVKLLKTNNSAKSPISRPNDFKDLRPPVRNRSFRTRNEFVSFSRFFAFADAVDFAAEAGNPSADRAVLPDARSSTGYGVAEGERLGTGCGLGVAKLRKSALKPLKSLTRVTLCAGAPDRVQARGPKPQI